jgi:TetR/AcrR family transcriptional regulator, lmrAB and yxaGH operons repressor
MSKGADSKAKTVAAAAALFRRRGYNGTGLHDILSAGGSPRGSLYFHFPKGKEEIGAAALSLAGDGVREAIAAAADASRSAVAFVTGIIRVMSANLESSNFSEGCPIATTALETAANSEVLRAAASNAFRSWEDEIRIGLERFGIKPKRAALTSPAILGVLEGALLLSRTHRSLEPMNRAEATVRLLLAPGAAA